MILDKLKEWKDNNGFNKENLLTIDLDELLDEIANDYSPITPLDYSKYNYIPIGIRSILNDSMEDNGILSYSPFYEALLLQTLYLESKGMDELYTQAIFAICPPAKAVLFFDDMLESNKEYSSLIKYYDRYSQKSITLLNNDGRRLQDKIQSSKEDLETITNYLKTLTESEVK